MQGILNGVGGVDGRSIAALARGLAVGEVLPARVVNTAGDRVVIRLPDRTLAAATTVPLEAGQHVDLLVARAGAGKIILRVVGGSASNAAPPRLTAPAAGTGASNNATRLPGIAASPFGGSSVTIVGHGSEVGMPPAARPVVSTPDSGSTSTDPRLAGGGLSAQRPAGGAGLAVARAWADLPASYDRLATVIRNPVALETSPTAPIATLAGPTTPTAAVAPGAARSDVAHLIADLGLPNDRLTTALVAELVARGAPLVPEDIRSLRRQLARLGGAFGDARPLVLLSRIGLPPTRETLALARQLAEGAPAPDQAWAEALAALERLSADPASGPTAGLVRDTVARWSPPTDGDAAALAAWLRQTLDDTATPLEAKLARPGLEQSDLDRDVLVRLDAFQQGAESLPRDSARGAREALDQLRTAVRAEQLQNAAPPESPEPRSFVFTMPAPTPEPRGTIELRVRERSAGPASPARPDRLQLSLELPRLGAVRVDLTVGRPSLACRFATDTPFATALLGARAAELAAGLRKLGYPSPIVDAVPQASLPPAAEPATGPPTGSLHRLDVPA